MVTAQQIEAAQAVIAGHVRRTPVMELEEGALGLSARLYLKLELTQHTGSFKPRGAFHRILTADVPEAGVITASGGNHGQAVAWACRALGLPAEIFVPSGSPPLKAERIRRYGATVTVTGEFYDDAMAACLRRADQTGALLVHPYDHPQVVAGQGTVGLELEQQLPDLDTVLVAAGGGGLAAGVAAWYAGRCRVVAVATALREGRPVDVSVGGVAADSLGARRVGRVPFEIARQHIAAGVLVPDEAIIAAQWRLWDDLRIITEPGGAASLAALLSGAYQAAQGERVGVVVCGANTAALPPPPA
jgi:threonine dehydratase